MAEKKDRVARFLHIKRHTKGTSNEISLSVLDSRNEGVDSVSAEPSSFADPEREIAHRKNRRLARKIVSGAVGAVVLVAAIGLTTYSLAVEYQKQSTYQALLHEALAEVTQADETIVTMDATIIGTVDEETVVKMKEIPADLPACTIILDHAEDTACTAFEGMRDSADKEAAGQAQAAITARKTMIEEGDKIMQASLKARNAAETLSSAWAIILSADATARDAAARVTPTTPENVKRSKEGSDRALSQFKEAKAKIEAAGASYATADLHLLSEYVNKRIEATNYALASDEAILVRDKKTAEANNAAYNQIDAQAAALSKQLPTDPTEPIYAAYDASISSSFSAYHDARRAAGTADSFLRDYLGTGSK